MASSRPRAPLRDSGRLLKGTAESSIQPLRPRFRGQYLLRINLVMPAAMRTRLDRAARAEMRSVSGYVGRVIVEALAREWRGSENRPQQPPDARAWAWHQLFL